MLGLVMLACAIFVAGKMADIEGRSPYLWGLGTGAAICALTWGLGAYLVFSNVIGLVGLFIALWIAKARDAKRAGREF